MKEWKYLIGSANDFIGAPEWASIIYTYGNSGLIRFCNGWKEGCKFSGTKEFLTRQYDVSASDLTRYKIIAQRTESFGSAIDLEFCKANPDHPNCKCKELFQSQDSKRNGDALMSLAWKSAEGKYNRPYKGITIDIYDVLQAFAVTNPATQHAIKKLLRAAWRGHKDKMQDLTEALKSIERAIELEKL